MTDDPIRNELEEHREAQKLYKLEVFSGLIFSVALLGLMFIAVFGLLRYGANRPS